jgi:O-antigen/teichoic acid export membrane protein
MSARPVTVLTAGRLIGVAVTFGIPLVLVRRFDPETFGTYRQIFLVYTTLFGIAQLGLAESLYYFVPKRERAGQFAANAIAGLAGVGLTLVVVLPLIAGVLGRLMANPPLAPYVPAFAIFLALMLVSAALEILMVSRQQYGRAAVTYAASDAIRAAALVVPAAVTRRLEPLLIGAVIFALVRVSALARYAIREFGPTLRFGLASLREQLRYSMPFAAAVGLDVAQANLHQFIVAAWSGPIRFAVYSVGCLQIPLVDLLATSAANVMMVRMCDHHEEPEAMVALWRQTISRLALALLPLVALLLLAGHDLIIFLFTARYAASVPVFLVSTAAIAMAVIPTDAGLRVYAETRYLFVLNLLRLGLIVSTIALFMHWWDLPGAMLVTVMATAVVKVLGVRRVAQRLGVSVMQALPWRELLRTAAIASLAVVPAVFVRDLVPPALFVRLAVGSSVYALVYAGLAWRVTPAPTPIVATAASTAA